jgi:NAD(P)-dependent dehydrogenase (short-subunit alcohol dehydrogenase family)
MGTGDQDAEAIRLDGQVALVTGAGRGIGRAIALALADAGASVAVCARSEHEVSRTAREIAEHDGHPLAVRADVSNRHDVESMVAQVEAEMGLVDLLVNNAGSIGTVGPLAETDPDEWWHTLEVNLRGPLYCSRAVLPGMLARRNGRIVNVSSGAGFTPRPMLSAYAVSKAALTRFSENLAVETRPYGVQVFTILPGLVRTTMSEGALSADEPSVRQSFGSAFASGAEVPPEKAARLVVYLASGHADALTGRFVHVNADVRKMIANVSDIEARDLYVLRQRTDPVF